MLTFLVKEIFMRYRSRLIYIEAEQWFPGKEIMGVITYKSDDLGTKVEKAMINSCHGVMEVRPGDYVIKGVGGDIYPCREDVFIKRYEAYEEK